MAETKSTVEIIAWALRGHQITSWHYEQTGPDSHIYVWRCFCGALGEDHISTLSRTLDSIGDGHRAAAIENELRAGQ